MRRCTRCLIEQPLEDFYVNAAYTGGYTTACKACIQQAARERRRANSAKDLLRKRVYREAHRQELAQHAREYKAKMRSLKAAQEPTPKPTQSGTKATRKIYIFVRDHGICQICHTRVHPFDASFDHVIPRSQGGTDSLQNLVLTHLWCNLSKGDRPITQQQRLFG